MYGNTASASAASVNLPLRAVIMLMHNFLQFVVCELFGFVAAFYSYAPDFSRPQEAE